MKCILLIDLVALVCLVCFLGCVRSDPGDYYKNINFNQTGEKLRSSLASLIFNHQRLSYGDIWDVFNSIDGGIEGCSSGTIRGLYSIFCWIPQQQQCGNYKKEGDCYNREHTWPKSWWGGFSEGEGAEVDLFLVFPADGYVNSLRSNYPYGIVDPSNFRYNTTSGVLIGSCIASPDYTGSCLEPDDQFKGVLARSFFYVSTCYAGQFSCCDTPATNGADLKPWVVRLFKQWHREFPVSDAEIQINELIFKNYQQNRNPFVDFPFLVDQIWNDSP